MALLEQFLRAQLDPATNGKGRPIYEYRLLVRSLESGVLALEVNPVGFESDKLICGVEQSSLLDEAATAQLVKDRADAAAALAAEVQAARDAEAAQKEADARYAEEVIAYGAALAQTRLGGAQPTEPKPPA